MAVDVSFVNEKDNRDKCFSSPDLQPFMVHNLSKRACVDISKDIVGRQMTSIQCWWFVKDEIRKDGVRLITLYVRKEREIFLYRQQIHTMIARNPGLPSPSFVQWSPEDPLVREGRWQR